MKHIMKLNTKAITKDIIPSGSLSGISKISVLTKITIKKMLSKKHIHIIIYTLQSTLSKIKRKYAGKTCCYISLITTARVVIRM